MWGVTVDKVLCWIRNGDLRAIDASARQSERPRYLIDKADIAAFEKSREVIPNGKVPQSITRHDAP
jgi:hypothetical protein